MDEPQLRPGFRFLQFHEIIQDGDLFHCEFPKDGGQKISGWIRIDYSYQNITVAECIERVSQWWNEPMFFATYRPRTEPKPEAIIIGKLLGNLE